MSRNGKKYEELTITDDFMFGKVMRNLKHCKKLLEIILEVKIRKIMFIDDQQAVNPDYRARSIRIDVYVEDDADTVYTVEMQTRNTGELPLRSRYYQSVVDVNLIGKGLDYGQLKKNYVIFICTFDLFGKGRHIYHFENLCREDPAIRLEDGTEKIFLNTKGTWMMWTGSFAAFWIILRVWCHRTRLPVSWRRRWLLPGHIRSGGRSI